MRGGAEAGALLPGGGRGGDLDESGLVTPEAVVLGLPIASVGSRAVALLVDGLLQGLGMVLLSFAAASVGSLALGWVGVSLLVLALFGLLFGYPVAFETLWRGRTPGKALMGLRVVTIEAAPVGLRHAAIRAALALVDFWISSGGVAVISALFTRRAQRLGDLAAGTVVIREGRRRRGVEALVFDPPPGAEGYAAQLDVSALDENDYLALRSVLARARSLGPAATEPLAAEALRAVAPRVVPSPPPGMPALTVLTCVAAAHQRRHRARARRDVSDWIWS